MGKLTFNTVYINLAARRGFFAGTGGGVDLCCPSDCCGCCRAAEEALSPAESGGVTKVSGLSGIRYELGLLALAPQL